jgi:heme A synthase
MTWFQRLLLLTIAATFLLVVVGGTVRATDSGLGCPDWPTCHGSLIPKAEKHTLIEYSHRTVAAAVGLIFLGVTWFAFRTERRRPVVFWLAFTAGMLLVAQIILGGVTVKKELPAEIVAAHLGVAMTFIAVLIVTAVISLQGSARRPAIAGWYASPGLRRSPPRPHLLRSCSARTSAARGPRSPATAGRSVTDLRCLAATPMSGCTSCTARSPGCWA